MTLNSSPVSRTIGIIALLSDDLFVFEFPIYRAVIKKIPRCQFRSEQRGRFIYQLDDLGSPLCAVPDFIYDVHVKLRFVTNQENAALVGLESTL